jgi:hypothetical protein
MHSNQETVEQVNRKYQPGDIVRHKKYLGIFRVLGYTNRLPDSNVFVQSFNSPETLCDADIKGKPIRVTFRDGTHLHNGSLMYKTVDVCELCIKEIPDLRCDLEFDNILNLI